MAKRILVVEDEKQLSGVLFLKLTNAGFDVTVADNGTIALDLLRKNFYDLVTLDLIMPGLNGFDVLEGLKKQNIKFPVVMLSNLNQSEDVQKAKELGAVDFILKSNTPIHEIVERIKALLEK
jgi:two-component system copper resistance phosphate regulon response regulator CusR